MTFATCADDLVEHAGTTDNWGRPPNVPRSTSESRASIVSQLTFSWIYPSLLLASKESLVLGRLDTMPSKRECCWLLGKTLASGLRQEFQSSRRWDKLLHKEVQYKGEPGSSGVLRWVGVLQRSMKPNIYYAGVEWRTPPTSSCLSDGSVDGEQLFKQLSEGSPCCSFEDVLAIRFVDGDAAPTPPRALNCMKVVHSAHRRLVIMQVLPRVITDCCVLAMPVVLEFFIRFLMMPDPSWQNGGIIVGSIFLLSLMQNLMTNMYTELAMRTGMAIRSSLTSCVIEKSLLVSQSALVHPDFSSGRIVNMVSNDIEKINQFWWTAMDLWSIPLQIVVAIGLLYRLVGWCGLAGVSVLLITIPLDGFILRKQSAFQANLSKVMDERIRNTVEVLSGIRLVKYMGWEPLFLQRIYEKRAQEIACMKQVHWCRVASSTINMATPRLVAALTVILYNVTGNDLTPQVIFPAVSLLAILRVPFMNLPTLFTNVSQYTVAMERLSKFFALEDALLGVQPIAPDEGAQSAVVLEDVTVQVNVPVKLPPLERSRNKKLPAGDFYSMSRKTILENISLRIPNGKLTVITGPTGCGKSTLLMTILGRVEAVGNVFALDSTAFVPQQAWIMNGSVRENIVFFSRAVDESALAAAIDACSLTEDIAAMSNGIDSDIGDRGINLSGGQKARISLARAVVYDKSLYLMDDILSALDVRVGNDIIQNCLNGILRGKTRVLVTHHDFAIKHADHIIAMDASKGIVFNGDSVAYSEFVQGSTTAAATPQPKPSEDISSKSLQTAAAAMQKVATVKEVAENSSRYWVQDTYAAFHLPDVESSDDDEDMLVSKTDNDDGTEMTLTSAHLSTHYYLSQANETTTEQRLLIQDMTTRRQLSTTLEEKASGSVPWRAYLEHFRACGGVAVIVLLLVVFAITEVINCSGSVWLSIWVEGSYNLSNREYLYVYIGVVVACFASAPIRFYLALGALRRGSLQIHNNMLLSILRAPVHFFDVTPLGRVINRFTRDVGLFDISLQLNYLGLLQCVFFACSSVGITIASQPVVAVALVPCGLLYYFLLVFFNRANREVRRLVNISTTPVMNVLNDVLSGSTTISAYKTGPDFLGRAMDALDVTFSAANLQNICNRWLSVRVEMLGNVMITAVALAGVVGKMLNFNSDNISLLSLGFSMTMSITQMLNWIVRQVAAVEADMNCVERLLFYTNHIDQESLPLEDYRKTPNAVSETKKPPAACAIEFHHVSARYRLGLPLVLQNVSFYIKAGEKIGVVGRTGSGKSTLLLTLLRIIEVADGGYIAIQKKRTNEMSLQEVRSAFSMIPQDPVLFEGTVRSNVDPFSECSDRMVWKALELAGIDGRISFDAGKLDMRVVFGGQNFSVGERQMLCLARALLKRGASCLLMDEATANVDKTIDAKIKETIKSAFRNHTIITVAHRLHTIIEYDRIMVMKDGRVAEFSSPSELVKNGGIFRDMLSALGGEEESALLAILARRDSTQTGDANEK